MVLSSQQVKRFVFDLLLVLYRIANPKGTIAFSHLRRLLVTEIYSVANFGVSPDSPKRDYSFLKISEPIFCMWKGLWFLIRDTLSHLICRTIFLKFQWIMQCDWNIHCKTRGGNEFKHPTGQISVILHSLLHLIQEPFTYTATSPIEGDVPSIHVYAYCAGPYQWGYFIFVNVYFDTGPQF